MFSNTSPLEPTPVGPAIGLLESIRVIRKHRTPGLFLSLLLLCSRAAGDSIQPQLPAEVSINKDAGRGGHLIVTLRLDSGEELPFIVDTGCSITLFEKSLEPRLEKRLGTNTSWIQFEGKEQESAYYAAPKVYVGSTPLMTGSNVFTYNFHRRSSPSPRPFVGILGLDCLRHYCIQLDFEAGKMRFLDPDHLPLEKLGKVFPLTLTRAEGQEDNQSIYPFIHHPGLLGGTSPNLLIDTGDNVDGAVEKGLIKGHYLARFSHFLVKSRAVRLPECSWDGETYRNLEVGTGKNANQLGLRFLARHLVTFDFPHQTMYLKQTSIGPLSFEEKR